jgi:uncharacterized protein
MRCPTCRRTLTDEDDRRCRPFCSQRCKLVDLGHWLDGSYAIPGDPASDEDLTGDLQPEEERSPKRR